MADQVIDSIVIESVLSSVNGAAREPIVLDEDKAILRYAVVKDGVVANVVGIREGDDATVALLGALPLTEDQMVNAGDLYANGVYTPPPTPPAPEPLPQAVQDARLAFGASMGLDPEQTERLFKIVTS